MNMQSKQWLPDLIGACASLVGLALLVVVARSGNAMGYSVGALIGGGFAFGVLGCVAKEVVTWRGDRRQAALRAMSRPSHALVSASFVAMPPLVDATGSEFDVGQPPAFAPVLSLTEAQVERQRERQIQGSRTRNRA